MPAFCGDDTELPFHPIEWNPVSLAPLRTALADSLIA
jgi:hypothetical protein